MKVLVYGAGVIGGQLVHALIKNGNDVTVIARGAWKDTLEKDGLRIRHYIQKKDTTDHPHVLEKPDGQRYDIAFAVMQYRQMEKILEDLAALNSPVVVLVGNNLSVSEMESRILRATASPKEVLFGFGSTAGTRENGKLTTVHAGDGKLTIGKAHAEATAEEKALLKQLFAGSRMSVSWCDNMDAWLKYHAAFVLPVVYLCYKTGCDLKRSTKEERKLLLDAARDAYHLLMGLGYPVRPAGDEKSLEPGLANELARLVIYWVSRTRLGALCTTEHCRHAPREMEDLDRAFQELRAKMPDFPMPHFDELYKMMPSWEEIRNTYI
ncbi:MAG: ketopantoate reductase family protein [Solobacterium sp.]|nr:ketopantoate reductase family protein [Solobacterium sp.]